MIIRSSIYRVDVVRRSKISTCENMPFKEYVDVVAPDINKALLITGEHYGDEAIKIDGATLILEDVLVNS